MGVLEQYVGEIRLFAGTYAPVDWHFCDGTTLAVSDYSALFSLIGITWGGDGRTTFNLPDFRGRVPIGTGQNSQTGTPYLYGACGGKETVKLDKNGLPGHMHSFFVVNQPATDLSPSQNALYAMPMPNGVVHGMYISASASDKAQAVMRSDAVSDTGGGEGHSNMMASLAVNYIIALNGNYPQRP
jgi:microcystin-dependent protein